MIVKKRTIPIADQRRIDNMAAQVAKQQANIDFIAIMSEIEIDDDEDENAEEMSNE